MPAQSKAQQRFFGMVRAAQKGEGAASPEVAKVADEISDKDAKKFAKTKHKGLPEKKKVDEATWHSVDGKKYLKLPRKHAKNAKRDTDSRSGLGKAKDAVTDTLGITNTKRDGVRKHDGIKGAFQIQNSYEPEGKLAEGDVPRGPGGNPIRIKDKIKAAKGFIPHKGKPTVDEGVGRAAIGAGVGAMVGGPVGAAAGAAIGASLGRKKVSSGAGGKKKPKNFFKAEPKVTSSESMEIKESVLDVVRKYAKKKKEKQPQKAQDAGARARRVMQRKEYASKVSGSTDNVPDNLRDSLQILKNLIQ